MNETEKEQMMQSLQALREGVKKAQSDLGEMLETIGTAQWALGMGTSWGKMEGLYDTMHEHYQSAHGALAFLVKNNLIKNWEYCEKRNMEEYQRPW